MPQVQFVAWPELYRKYTVQEGSHLDFQHLPARYSFSLEICCSLLYEGLVRLLLPEPHSPLLPLPDTHATVYTSQGSPLQHGLLKHDGYMM